MPGVRKLLIDLALLVAIGVVLALIGPFGTFQASFGSRLLYWVALALAGYLFYRPIGGVADWAARWLDLPVAAMWVVATLVATVPMTFVVRLTSCGGPCPTPQTIDELLVSYGYVLVIGAAVTLILFLTQRGRAPIGSMKTDSPPPSPAPSPAPPPAPRFLERLPAHLGQELIALEMEDHYVRAHMAGGSDLILMRLRDAVGELEGIDGAQVHRSWWVARAAVATIRRDGRNIRLVLTNGIEAPVSREKARSLKALGWL
ncbi:LytTR family transcriptional regulator [Sphingomonas suaedae]|uniref:LytTR family transcriptional regulator n=1 Tax=Sphingomonas suaedae TaxID=2599297 RepID=A0A518RLE8_9SPHN|nr:LytTR family transcriptional regulator [Sphingomonas suaedae]